MATQLERPSRVERIGASKIGGKANPINKAQNVVSASKNVFKKGITLEFICMALVAGTLDILSLFLSEFPGVGIIFSILALVIFIPWFYFSKNVNFSIDKMISMTLMAVGEGIPIVGNLPCITANVFFTYYSD